MYKCIVIDDDDMVLSSLSSLIKSHEGLELSADFLNAEDARKFIEHQDVDLIFTDVMLPGENGIQFLRNIDTTAHVVVISSDKEFAVDAFNLNVLDYLHKPISTERFNVTIEKFMDAQKSKVASVQNKERKTARQNALFVKVDMIYRKIDYNEIYFLAKEGNYIKIVTKKDEIRLYSTLKELESKLPPEQFVRVHRSFTVNLDHILGIDENSIISPKDLVPISKDRKKLLMELLGA